MYFDSILRIWKITWHFELNVTTQITDLREFVRHLSAVTNMKVLTGDAAIGKSFFFNTLKIYPVDIHHFELTRNNLQEKIKYRYHIITIYLSSPFTIILNVLYKVYKFSEAYSETHHKLIFVEGDCGFLAANMCAHSIFGEDALANVSIEKVI